MLKFITLFFLVIFSFSCKTTQPAEDKEEIITNDIPPSLADKLMIELEPGVDADNFALSYSNYGLKKKYLASKSKNLYMFIFNPQAITLQELKKRLLKKKQVINVEALSDKLKDPSANMSEKKKTVQMK